MTTEVAKYHLNATGLKRVTEKLETLNRKLSSRLLPPVTLEVREVSSGQFECWLSGSAPPLPDTRLLGVVHHLTDQAGEPDNIVFAAPGCSVPATYRTASPMCDHCGLLRRRHETYIFRAAHTGDRTFQVGRNCAAEYLASEDLAAGLLTWVATFQDLIGVLTAGHGAGTPTHWTPREVIEATCVVVAEHGWVSRAKSQQTGATSTAFRVLELLERNGALLDFKDHARVEAVCNWLIDLRERDESATTDYLHNLATAFAQQVIDSRFVGLLCSAVAAYEREQAVTVQAAAQPAIQESGVHFGALKQRQEAYVSIDTIKHVGENEWGQVFLVTMHTPEGHLLKWFTGENCKLEVGKSYHVKLTPDEHNVWNGRKETKVSRVAEFVPPPPKQSKPRRAKAL